MRLFLYYSLHSFKNQLKKIFKSWFVIFLLACMLFGAVIGIFASVIEEKAGGGNNQEEQIEDDTVQEEITEEEAKEAYRILELVVGGVLFAYFIFNLIISDKSGSSIFTMADVNLLFSAPMKPQSVLLFKIMNQILLLVVSSVYLLFQIPNLSVNVGLDALTIVFLLLAWVFMLVYGKLINVFVFTLTSSKTRLKKYIRPFAYVITGILIVSFYCFYLQSGNGLLNSAFSFFNSVITRYIPVIGWIKGIVCWAYEGEIVKSVIFTVILTVGVIVFAYGIWHIKADFYEEAMAKSEEMATAFEASKNGNTVRRKKDRADSIQRDGMKRGSGANIFFFKAMYNRFRFARLGFLTKTAITYLVIATGVSLIQKIILQKESFFIVGLVLCAIAFFRALGNPLSADMEKPYFITVPASSYSKVFWSVLAGATDCALDLIIPFAVSAVILKADIVTLLIMFLLALSINLYSGNVLLFIELSLPSSIAFQLKQGISIMFIYFGLLPVAGIIIAGYVMDFLKISVFASALFCAVIGVIFYVFSPLLLDRGKK